MNIQNKILLGIGSIVGIMLLVGWIAINEPARMEVFTEQWHGRSIERGADLYLNNCAPCHGADGLGLAGVAPALRNPLLFLEQNPARVANEALQQSIRQQRDLQRALTTYEESVTRRVEVQQQLSATAEGTPERQQLQEELEALDAQIRLFDTGTQARIEALTTQIAEQQAELDRLRAEGWDPDRDVRMRELAFNGSLEDYLHSTLVGGRPTSRFYWPAPMPAWAQPAGPLRPDEIDNLVAFLINYRDESLALTPNDIYQGFKRPVDSALAGAGQADRQVLGLDVDILDLTLTGGDVAQGRQLYAALGCAGCHTAPSGAAYSFAPTAGSWTRVVNIRMRVPEIADRYETPEQYLAASIIYPNEYIVPGGSAGLMPLNFGEALTLEELQHLIAYIQTYE